MSINFQRNISFEEAKRTFSHRFTMEHVPEWSQHQRSDGTFYAPHFATDREWYDNYRFPGDEGLSRNADSSECVGVLTWPLGQSLSEPFSMDKVSKISEVTFAIPGEDYTTLRLSRELTPSEIEDVVAGRVTSEFKLTLPVVEGLYGKVKSAYSMGDGDIDMDADVFCQAILGHLEPKKVKETPALTTGSPSP